MAKTNYNKISNTQKEVIEETVVEAPEVIEEAAVVEETVIEETVVEAPVVEKKIGVVSNCSKLNVRINPNTNAFVALVIPQGTEVEIGDSVGDFYHVSVDGFDGWCMKKYISVK